MENPGRKCYCLLNCCIFRKYGTVWNVTEYRGIDVNEKIIDFAVDGSVLGFVREK